MSKEKTQRANEYPINLRSTSYAGQATQYPMSKGKKKNLIVGRGRADIESARMG